MRDRYNGELGKGCGSGERLARSDRTRKRRHNLCEALLLGRPCLDAVCFARVRCALLKFVRHRPSLQRSLQPQTARRRFLLRDSGHTYRANATHVTGAGSGAMQCTTAASRMLISRSRLPSCTCTSSTCVSTMPVPVWPGTASLQEQHGAPLIERRDSLQFAVLVGLFRVKGLGWAMQNPNLQSWHRLLQPPPTRQLLTSLELLPLPHAVVVRAGARPMCQTTTSRTRKNSSCMTRPACKSHTDPQHNPLNPRAVNAPWHHQGTHTPSSIIWRPCACLGRSHGTSCEEKGRPRKM